MSYSQHCFSLMEEKDCNCCSAKFKKSYIWFKYIKAYLLLNENYFCHCIKIHKRAISIEFKTWLRSILSLRSSKQTPVTSLNMVKNINWTDLCILRPEVLFWLSSLISCKITHSFLYRSSLSDFIKSLFSGFTWPYGLLNNQS